VHESNSGEKIQLGGLETRTRTRRSTVGLGLETLYPEDRSSPQPSLGDQELLLQFIMNLLRFLLQRQQV